MLYKVITSLDPINNFKYNIFKYLSCGIIFYLVDGSGMMADFQPGAAGRNTGQGLGVTNEKGNSPRLQTYKNHMCMW